jgi:hypothetical protein
MDSVSQHGPLRTVLERHCIDCHIDKIFKLIQILFTREVCGTAARLFCILKDKQHGLPNLVNFHIFNEAGDKDRSCASSLGVIYVELHIFDCVPFMASCKFVQSR